MAAAIQKELGVDAQIAEGSRGEWRVLVDGQEVAKKGWISFPSDAKVVEAVRAALAREAPDASGSTPM